MSAKLSYQRHTTPPVPFPEGFSWQESLCPQQLQALSQRCSEADTTRNADHELWRGHRQGWLDTQRRAAVLLGGQQDLGKLELHVDPLVRGNGWGTEMLQRGCSRLQELGYSLVDVWAYGDVNTTVAWLQKHDFVSHRLLYTLRRQASPPAAVDWPADCQVRPFAWSELSSWHRLHLRMQADPRLAWTEEALRAQLARPETSPENFWLLWRGQNLLGYLSLKRTEAESEIFLFALAPESRGQGLGRALLQWGLNHCDQPVICFCDDARPAALGLLRSAAFQEVGRDRCLRRCL